MHRILKINQNWNKPDFDDSSWREITYSFGQYFWKLGPLPNVIDNEPMIHPKEPVQINGKSYNWQPYEFSMRWGIEGDPGHQGYHGLKGKVTDDFIALGKAHQLHTSIVYEKEDEGSIYYLWTSVKVEEEIIAKLLFNIKPEKIWINGICVDSDIVKLNSGSNIIILRYDQPCRTHFVLASADANPSWQQTYPLAMSWYNNPDIMTFDAYPDNERSFGYYRFISPPGLIGMTINAYGKMKAYADGIDMQVNLIEHNRNGSNIFEAVVHEIQQDPVVISIQIEQEHGFYGGSALPEPIKLHCEKGKIELGDWSKIDGLASYSGGACYQKTFMMHKIGNRIVLDLGNVVSSAEVFINGKLAGIKLAPPWNLDITDLVKIGENNIRVIVYNTLANHYLTIPTRYRGALTSGILGPVNIHIITYKH